MLFNDFSPPSTNQIPPFVTPVLKPVRVHKESGFIKSTNNQSGSGNIKQGSERVRVDEKRMINSRADVNQLMPIRYQWAWEAYLDGCANHWMPTEVAMDADIAIWRDPQGLSADERRMIQRNLGFFAVSESLVNNNIVLAVYRHLRNPECRQYLLRQAFEEALHTHTFQYIVESLKLDEGEVFNLYQENPSVHAKAAWALKYTQELSDPQFVTGSVDRDRLLLKNLIALYVCMESLWFYTGFAQILSLGRRNKMVGIAKMYQYIMRDESVHFNFGIDAINQIRNENPGLWNRDFELEVIGMIREAVELEVAYAEDSMPRGILGMNVELVRAYMQFTANRRFTSLGVAPQFGEVENPFPWLAEMMEIRKSENFFEQKVTEYSKAQLSFQD